jgi:hypothetical protein
LSTDGKKVGSPQPVPLLSLSTIVPVPLASAIVALPLTMPVSSSVKVSGPSRSVSLRIGTAMVWVVSPARKVRVPLTAV